MTNKRSTVKLYDTDPYGTSFTGTVLSCKEENEKGFAVVLDRTLFFPEEGGQSPDKGSLGGAKVLDVQIRQDKEDLTEVITHYLDRPLEAGSRAEGCIDWTHRFNNMQQHSGEHIFSGMVHRLFGYDNVGFHLSDQVVTMDFNGPLNEEEIRKVETLVNEAIFKNVPITVSYPSKEELKNLDYRSKIDIAGQVRIVTVEGYDVCACCAPHVRRTGEIGLLKVMHTQNYKGGVRISILCGFRALSAFREKNAIIAELTGMMTTSQENIAANVEKLKESNQELKNKLAQAEQKLTAYEIKALDPGLSDVYLFKEGLENNAIRNTVNRLMESYDGFCGVFSGNDTEGYSFVIGSKDKDCNELAKALRSGLAARGGGKPRMIQGSVKESREAVEKFLKAYSL